MDRSWAFSTTTMIRAPGREERERKRGRAGAPDAHGLGTHNGRVGERRRGGARVVVGLSKSEKDEREDS